MMRNKFFFTFIAFFFLLIVVFLPTLHHRPVMFFILKGADENIEAYKMRVFLNGQDSLIDPISLTIQQKKVAREIIVHCDVENLEIFAKNFGEFSFVLGLSSLEEKWPSYLGGEDLFFFQDSSKKYFDNLNWLDRFYFYLNIKKNISRFLVPIIQTQDIGKVQNSNFVQSSIKVLNQQVRSRVVRVEILNGCGITNAAEWVARKINGSGVLITSTGNADHFNYSKTIIRTSTGDPVALEETLERLGLSKDNLEETADQPVSVDAVIIVGHDFLKLKEMNRERSDH